MNLPDDIIGELYLRMPPIILANFRRTCTRANILADDEFVWQRKKLIDFSQYHVHRDTWQHIYKSLARCQRIKLYCTSNGLPRTIKYLNFKWTMTLREFMVPAYITIGRYHKLGFAISCLNVHRRTPTNFYLYVGYIGHPRLRGSTILGNSLKLHLFPMGDAINLLLDMPICHFPEYTIPGIGKTSFYQLLRYMTIGISLPGHQII